MRGTCTSTSSCQPTWNPLYEYDCSANHCSSIYSIALTPDKLLGVSVNFLSVVYSNVCILYLACSKFKPWIRVLQYHTALSLQFTQEHHPFPTCMHCITSHSIVYAAVSSSSVYRENEVVTVFIVYSFPADLVLQGSNECKLTNNYL